MHDDRDETIERVRAALKPLPPADSYAVARVLSAVHGRTPQPTPRWREFLDWVRMPSLSIAGAGGLVVAASFAGYVVSGQLSTRAMQNANTSVPGLAVTPGAVTPQVGSLNGPSALALSASPESVPVIPASAVDEGERFVPVQFVLNLQTARTVSVVGDFNDWTINDAPMQKVANGAWSVTLPVKPGRHEYAFVVDGEKWIADPRAPKATDSDFGKPGSVIVVNTP